MDEDSRAAARNVAAAEGVIYCRVCGALMTEDNTVDPVELPDECIDHFEIFE